MDEKLLAGLEWGNRGAMSYRILTSFFSNLNYYLKKNNKIQENGAL